MSDLIPSANEDYWKARAAELGRENEILREALKAFVEAWEKSHQLEKTDVALRMARAALQSASDDDN